MAGAPRKNPGDATDKLSLTLKGSRKWEEGGTSWMRGNSVWAGVRLENVFKEENTVKIIQKIRI